MSDPNNPNTPNDYPTNPGYPGSQQEYPQQPSYPPQPGYPPQTGYPQQQGYPPQPGAQPPYVPPPQQPVTPPPYQPSPVQQPSYAQPGYPQQPMYAPPAAPQKSSNRGLFIGCGIALVVVLVICGVVGVVAYIGAQQAGNAVQNFGTAAQASLTVTEFCTDMQTQSYGQAYQLLSSSQQSKQTQDQFVQAMQNRDTKDGAIQLCTLQKSDALPTINGSNATIQIQVARGDANNVKVGTLSLVEESNDWKVSSADSSLDLI